MDRKLEYIVQTFSRTNKKNYENYVINAIWNRVNNHDLKPVTQQYVSNDENNKYKFIDLYFPQLNLGIEIDEGYHKNRKEEDKNRFEMIWYELNKVSENSYKEIRMQVYDKSYEEIENQINEVVVAIKEKIKDGFDQWLINVEDYVAALNEISIDDDIVFKSIKDTCNLLFNTGYQGIQSSFFTPRTFKDNEEFNNHMVWFPKLAVKKNGSLNAVSLNWNNRLNTDGSIVEFNENENIEYVDPNYEELIEDNEPFRITFAKAKDPRGIEGYRFTGIYRKSKHIALLHHSKHIKANYYERISETCRIIR